MQAKATCGQALREIIYDNSNASPLDDKSLFGLYRYETVYSPEGLIIHFMLRSRPFRSDSIFSENIFAKFSSIIIVSGNEHFRNFRIHHG